MDKIRVPDQVVELKDWPGMDRVDLEQYLQDGWKEHCRVVSELDEANKRIRGLEQQLIERGQECYLLRAIIRERIPNHEFEGHDTHCLTCGLYENDYLHRVC